VFATGILYTARHISLQQNNDKVNRITTVAKIPLIGYCEEILMLYLFGNQIPFIMKHSIKYAGVLYGSMLLLVVLSHSCKQNAVIANADIDTTYEMTPPIAKDITVKVLDKEQSAGNVMVTAKFDRKVLKNPYHAIMVNDEKLVLRDDGEGGDEKKDDGVFSIILKEDINQFRQELLTVQKRSKQFIDEKRNIFKWVNRSAVPISEKLREFDLLRIDTARILRIDPDILFAKAPDPVLNDHSLMITDIGVVEDPARTFNPCTGTGTANGAWTFGKLMSDMANTPVTSVSGEDFVKAWLDKWMNTQTVNSDNIASRTNIFLRLIVPWIVRSNPGIPPASITMANWKTKTLQLQFAPFKLLAIVNRLDLRGNSGYRISKAGEGRFVFGALQSNCQPLTGPGKFTVIFEYGIPKTTCISLHAFAQQWLDLKMQTPGTPAYNSALQVITDQFAAANAGGTRPNGSSLNQVRTNELAIGNPWELREFNIVAASHLLEEVPVTQEPAKIYNRLAVPAALPANQAILADYVNNNESSILDNTYNIPRTLPTTPPVNFLGGKAHTENPGHFWDAGNSGPGSITNNTARHILSINTCSGCHGGEGKTSIGNLIHDPAGVSHEAFLQITPQPFGTKATLSAFLTGDPGQADGLFRVLDPAGRPSEQPGGWTFNDLARRNSDLQELVEQSCKNKIIDLIRGFKFKPVRMTH